MVIIAVPCTTRGAAFLLMTPGASVLMDDIQPGASLRPMPEVLTPIIRHDSVCS
jgi:hypothetical protein